LKYQKCLPSGCTDKGNEKFGFEARNQLLETDKQLHTSSGIYISLKRIYINMFWKRHFFKNHIDVHFITPHPPIFEI